AAGLVDDQHVAEAVLVERGHRVGDRPVRGERAHGHAHDLGDDAEARGDRFADELIRSRVRRVHERPHRGEFRQIPANLEYRPPATRVRVWPGPARRCRVARRGSMLATPLSGTLGIELPIFNAPTGGATAGAELAAAVANAGGFGMLGLAGLPP